MGRSQCASGYQVAQINICNLSLPTTDGPNSHLHVFHQFCCIIYQKSNRKHLISSRKQVLWMKRVTNGKWAASLKNRANVVKSNGSSSLDFWAAHVSGFLGMHDLAWSSIFCDAVIVFCVSLVKGCWPLWFKSTVWVSVEVLSCVFL